MRLVRLQGSGLACGSVRHSSYRDLFEDRDKEPEGKMSEQEKGANQDKDRPRTAETMRRSGFSLTPGMKNGRGPGPPPVY